MEISGIKNAQVQLGLLAVLHVSVGVKMRVN